MGVTDDAKDLAASSIKGSLFPIIAAAVVYLLASGVEKARKR